MSGDSFFDNILRPGSAFHPTFLAILDVAFSLLLLVLAGLAATTSATIHFMALIVIELCLWASIKWFISEWKKAVAEPKALHDEKKTE